MTEGEAKVLVGLVAATFDKAFDEVRESVYVSALIDVPLEVGREAIRRLLLTATFFPVPSEIRKAVVDQIVHLPTAERAWHQVETLLAKFPSHPDATWSPPIAPHPMTWRVLREVGGLWNLAHSENWMADRAHFLKLYADLREQEMIQAVASPVAYLEAMAPAIAEMQAWQRGHALAAANPPLALPAVASPPPPEFQEALARLTERTKVPALLPAEGEVARG